jgi:N-acetyl-gamma-glutamyl-phosphate reductase
MIKAGIIGGTGMTGRELIRILVNHPSVKITCVTSRGSAGKKVAEAFPEVNGMTDLSFVAPDDPAVFGKTDVIFVCLPHTEAMDFVKLASDKGKKVIDLSADYRIQDVKTYRKWYKNEHKFPELLKKAVYGLPEFFREKIKKADVTANPGCYASTMLLGAGPALGKYPFSDVIIDAKSGISGAGVKPTNTNTFLHVNENTYPYNAGRAHRHIAEVEEIFYAKFKKKTQIVFTPQIIPVERGIMANIYIKLNKWVDVEKVRKYYSEFYKGEPFVRIVDAIGIHQVQNTNFCDIKISGVEERSMLVVFAALDNMRKGASGQAVQNMNLMFGLDEKEGLL